MGCPSAGSSPAMSSLNFNINDMKKNYYDIVALIGLVIWLGGSWYFGWNDEALSVGENITDNVGTLLMFYGFLNSVARGFKTEINLIYSSDIKIKE